MTAYTTYLSSNDDNEKIVQESRKLQEVLPKDSDRVQAMINLAQVSETLLDPIFGGTDCLGSVMRKRIKPVSEPLLVMVSLLHD